MPLNAELAKRALASVAGLSEEGLWGMTLSRLRARRRPPPRMHRIEEMARKIGDQPTAEQLEDFSVMLAGNGLTTSSVTFEPEEEGVTVRYHLMGHPETTGTVDPTKSKEVTLPIGLYHIWTERDGRATSPKKAWFPVIRERERIRVYENR